MPYMCLIHAIYVPDSCHTRASLKTFPNTLVKQASENSMETKGVSFATNVLKRNRQLVLLLCEIVTSFTTACIIDSEKHETLRDALTRLCVGLHPLDNPFTVSRLAPAHGFFALQNDDVLKQLRIYIEIGRVKKINKSPVAKKATRELNDGLLRQEPGRGPVSQLGLAFAITILNSYICSNGLSTHEL